MLPCPESAIFAKIGQWEWVGVPSGLRRFLVESATFSGSASFLVWAMALSKSANLQFMIILSPAFSSYREIFA